MRLDIWKAFGNKIRVLQQKGKTRTNNMRGGRRRDRWLWFLFTRTFELCLMARHEWVDFNSIDCCFGHQQTHMRIHTHTHTDWCTNTADCLEYRVDLYAAQLTLFMLKHTHTHTHRVQTGSLLCFLLCVCYDGKYLIFVGVLNSTVFFVFWPVKQVFRIVWFNLRYIITFAFQRLNWSRKIKQALVFSFVFIHFKAKSLRHGGVLF